MKTLIILCSFFAIMFSSCNNEDDSQRVVIDPTALELNSFDELKTLKSGVEIAKKGDDYIYLGVVQHLMTTVKKGLTIQSRNNSDSTSNKNEFERCHEHQFENR